MGRITKIKYNQQEEPFDIGTTFDNVHYDEDNSYSLKDFFDFIKEYFEQDMFSIYSSKEPSNTHIKVWYDTSETSDS